MLPSYSSADRRRACTQKSLCESECIWYRRFLSILLRPINSAIWLAALVPGPAALYTLALLLPGQCFAAAAACLCCSCLLLLLLLAATCCLHCCGLLMLPPPLRTVDAASAVLYMFWSYAPWYARRMDEQSDSAVHDSIFIVGALYVDV